ncbi:two-component sensor histidine kinase [Loigolactobacillus backii]|uniref:histidine kinase n=1 Tax=Loigolactobacillus backii TaxID=375175 RepID=A0A192GZF2_9LACO|nr:MULTISPECIES: HAMP domain-containing sensor histidine kinase [Loigolactobacillus]ANK58865.1 two-component sensor histidine kinase [Loigolactobacillus backii]ANK61470.1 two-component sensor histidine kinase [Loigolactobacillus backii]ANK63855.1 two-component sensor histidine kinase [Loigolactobacillus backii]ANK66303.1 two-component sensor histidine kinase [Loigolactobacillus backii]ANK69331.1 two-component sensor histidine kinase [Loigolactobacillus backii]
MKLTGREKSALFIEGVTTVILLLLLNLSVIVLANQAIHTNRALNDGIFQIKNAVSIGPNNFHLMSWQNIFTIFMLVFDALVVYWRLIRRYHQMQLSHVISELHHIADGHFEHRIPFTLRGDLQRVILSINALVDSTVKAMDDERRIEDSKDELITNVSHDIRTPLTSIIGYLGLIEDHQYQNEAQILKYTHIAFGKAKQMQVLVEDLFEYTKVRQTSTPVTISQIDMGQMLEQLAASFELEAEKKQLLINVKYRPDPLMMDADPEKLSRVFNNLISNALKYGKDAKHIFLEAKQEGTQVMIKVSNDGSPIPKEALSQLFDRFYRVEESRSKETGGTGLGLAIAQSIVSLHGGYIYATSDRHLTSFVMYLPVKHGVKLEIPKQYQN